MHIHFHVVVLDGVFTRDDAGALSFHVALEPTRAELSAIVRSTHRRARAWLERREGVTPNVLSVRHWSRLLDGALLAPPARVDGATLLRRTFAVDVLECRACQGRLRIIGAYTKADIVRRILTNLGLTTVAPVPARARDPTALLTAPAVY